MPFDDGRLQQPLESHIRQITMQYTLPAEPGAPYVGGSNNNDDSAASSPNGATDASHTLEEAIETATASRLRTVLHQMCQDSHLVRDLATKALLSPTITPTEGTSESNLNGRRKRKRFEVCEQCNDEYEVERNEMGLCVYHPGKYSLSKHWISASLVFRPSA